MYEKLGWLLLLWSAHAAWCLARGQKWIVRLDMLIPLVVWLVMPDPTVALMAYVTGYALARMQE